MYSCRILTDSVNPIGNRLTTFQITYNRFVHSELMTHRLFSRNASSSRAIPIEKMIEAVETDPAMPVYWGRNQRGMQAGEELEGVALEEAKLEWLAARDAAVSHAQRLTRLGVHKQIVNRLLEPWMFITVICSATEYANFFHLRCHPDAQPEIRHLAELMAAAYKANEPVKLSAGEWHTPLLGFPGDEELSDDDRLKVSVGRCARVSYLTHDGRRDPQADIALCDRLAESGHWSPFEHVAKAMSQRGEPARTGNFTGWQQYRKYFAGEHRREWNG